jgi:hypothetical protein
LAYGLVNELLVLLLLLHGRFFYLLILLLRERDGAKAWSAFRQSFAVDPAWLLRLPTLCVRHVLERKARRGRRIG